MNARWPAATAVLVGFGMAIAGCSTARTANAPGDVVLSEWQIDALPPDDLTLNVVNAGQRAHQLVVSDTEGNVLSMTDLLLPGDTERIGLPELGRLELTSRFIGTAQDGSLEDDTSNGMFLEVEWNP